MSREPRLSVGDGFRVGCGIAFWLGILFVVLAVGGQIIFVFGGAV